MPMPAALRPDRCGVIFAKNDYDSKTVFISVSREHPDALNAPLVKEHIAREEVEGVVAEYMPS